MADNPSVRGHANMEFLAELAEQGETPAQRERGAGGPNGFVAASAAGDVAAMEAFAARHGMPSRHLVREALAAACQENRAESVAHLARNHPLPRESVRDSRAAIVACRHADICALRQLAAGYGLLREDLCCLFRRARARASVEFGWGSSPAAIAWLGKEAGKRERRRGGYGYY